MSGAFLGVLFLWGYVAAWFWGAVALNVASNVEEFALLADADPWAAALPSPQALPEDLVAEGHTIPVARVQAMHEGKRRARAQHGTD